MDGSQDNLPPANSTNTSGNPSAGALLEKGLQHDRAGMVDAALDCYRSALREAETTENRRQMAEALRRLGVLEHRSGDIPSARELCERSFEVARLAGEMTVAAEALNALGGFALESGEIDEAETLYGRALDLVGADHQIRSHIQQNLGVLANIQGDLPKALAHYEGALQASQRAGDERAAAVSYHNLGMVSADMKRWPEAQRYFQESHDLAERVNDAHLRALCLLNRTEVLLAIRSFEDARHSVEEALTIFDRLNSTLDKADAYKMLGAVFRETGEPALAEARLRTAIELAVTTGAVLSEAEARRELAILFQGTGRNQDALTQLNAAHRLFSRLRAGGDLVDVASKVTKLETTYMSVVRDWGQSIESADSYTYGHCERVANYATAVAAQLGMDEVSLTAIRLGAYIHDVGKVRVPHEILNKPASLTPEEFEIIKKHPAWGVELIADVDFPWDIKPIVMSHHEKVDGTGYPAGLRGDDVPLSAQIVCVADVYDALTTTRSYRPAMTRQEALRVMEASCKWWHAEVYDAFKRTVAE